MNGFHFHCIFKWIQPTATQASHYGGFQIILFWFLNSREKAVANLCIKVKDFKGRELVGKVLTWTKYQGRSIKDSEEEKGCYIEGHVKLWLLCSKTFLCLTCIDSLMVIRQMLHSCVLNREKWVMVTHHLWKWTSCFISIQTISCQSLNDTHLYRAIKNEYYFF